MANDVTVYFNLLQKGMKLEQTIKQLKELNAFDNRTIKVKIDTTAVAKQAEQEKQAKLKAEKEVQAQRKKDLEEDRRLQMNLIKDAKKEKEKALKEQQRLELKAIKEREAAEKKAAQQRQQNMQKVASLLSTTSSATGKLYKFFTDIPQKVARFSDQFVHLGQVFSTFAYRMTLITAPLDAFLYKTGKAAMDLEEQALMVATQVDGTKAEVIEFAHEVEFAMTNMAIKTGIAAGDLTKALYYITSSMDVTKEAARGMVEPIGVAAQAGGSSASVVSEAVATAFNVFGGDLSRFGSMADQTTHVVDVMFEAVRRGRAELEDIAVGFGRAGKMGELAGQSFEEVVAVVAGLSRVFTAAQATTGAENLAKALVDPSSDAVEMWDSLGIAMYEMVDGVQQRRSVLEIFVELMDKISGMNVSSVEKVMSALFPNIRGMRAALVIQNAKALENMTTWAEEWSEIAPDLYGEEAGVGRGFGIVGEGANFALEVIRELATAIGGDVFRSFREDIMGVLEGVTGLLTQLRNIDPATQKMIWQFALMLSALGPLSLIIGTLLMGLGGLVTTIAQLMTPMGIIGLTAIWRSFGDILGDTWAVIQDYVGEAGFKGLIALVGDLAKEFGFLEEKKVDEIMEAFGVTEDIDSENFASFVTSAKEFGQGVKDTFEKVKSWFQAFALFIEKTADKENSFGKIIGFLEGLAKFFLDLGAAVAGTAANDVERMAAAIDLLASSLAVLAGISIGSGLISKILMLKMIATGGAGTGAASSVVSGGSIGAASGTFLSKLIPGGLPGIGNFLTNIMPAGILNELFYTPEGQKWAERWDPTGTLYKQRVAGSVAGGTMTPEAAIREHMERYGVDRSTAISYLGGTIGLAPGRSTRQGLPDWYSNAMATARTEWGVPKTYAATPGGGEGLSWLGSAQELSDPGDIRGMKAMDRLAVTVAKVGAAASGATSNLVNVKNSLEAIGMGVGGDWWEAFKEEHGGTDPLTKYKKHARPLQAALIDKMWGDQFAQKHGRAPTDADWQQHWYEYWMPLEQGKGGDILEPTGAAADAANALLESIKGTELPNINSSVEEFEKASVANQETVIDRLDTLIALETGAPITPPLGGSIDPATGKPAGRGDIKAAGGYAWEDRLYRMAEGGMHEYTLSNRTTEFLENQIGLLTQDRIMGLAGGASVLNVGNITLPNVTNPEEFIHDLAREADGLVRVGYVR